MYCGYAGCHIVIERINGSAKALTGPLPRLDGGHQPAPAFFASLSGVPKCKHAPSR